MNKSSKANLFTMDTYGVSNLFWSRIVAAENSEILK